MVPPVVSDISAHMWTSAAWFFDLDATVEGTWTINAGGVPHTVTMAAGSSIADLTSALATEVRIFDATQSKTDRLAPAISGTTVTFDGPWPDGPVPSGLEYSISPFNPNEAVNEVDQVDTLNVSHGNSPADDIGYLTTDRLTGLGMGPDAIIGGQRINGGITYSALEEIFIELGTGDNHFVIESTHEGSTTITSGPGADVFDINEILGHTEIYTGANSDIVNVGSQVSYVAPTSTGDTAHLVNTIGALLTIDGGTDEITGTGAEATITTTVLDDQNADFPTRLGNVMIDYKRFKVDVRTQADIGELSMTVDALTGVPTGELRFEAKDRFEGHDVFVFNYELCQVLSSDCSIYVVVIDETLLGDDRVIDIDVRTVANRDAHVVDLVGSTIDITDTTGTVHTSLITANDSDSVTFDAITAGITVATYRISSSPKRGDILAIDNSGDQTDNVVTVTQTTVDGLNIPSIPEVQTVFVKAASGTYTLIAEVDGDEIEIPFEYNLSAEGFQARLRAYYEFEGIDVTAVRTSRAVTYTIEFARFQAGRDFAELRWDVDSSELTANNGDSAEIETATLREGRNAPIAEVQTINVQAKTGLYLLRVEGFGRDYFDKVDHDLSLDDGLKVQRDDDNAAVTVDYDATAAELAAALNQLFGYTGITVVEERDETTETVMYAITFGGVEIGRNVPTLLPSQTDDFGNDGTTINPLDGTPVVLTIAGFGTDNSDINAAADVGHNISRTADAATLTVSFDDTAAEVAAALDQLLGLNGLTVTKRVSGTKAIFTIDQSTLLNVGGVVLSATQQILPIEGEETDVLFGTLTFAATAQEFKDAIDVVITFGEYTIERTQVGTAVAFLLKFPDEPATISAAGLGEVSISALESASEAAAKLNTLFGRTDIAVKKLEVGTNVEFTLSQTGTNIEDIDLNALIALDDFVLAPAEGKEKPLLSGDTLTDGKKLNNLQTLTVNASGGSFDLTLLGTPVTIPFDASAADLICNVEDRRRLTCGTAVLEDIVNPNNSNDALPFTNNLAVRKHGNVLHFIFQGEYRHLTIDPADIDTSNLLGANGQVGTVTLDDRNAGINYYNIDVLDIDLGDGDDVANIQGTSAATNVRLRGGDDRIYISDEAALDNDTTTEFLTGTLDDIDGLLNIRGGAGSQTLMISDEAALDGDNVLITDRADRALALDPTVPGSITELADNLTYPQFSYPDTDTEIYIVGLSEGAITFSAGLVDPLTPAEAGLGERDVNGFGDYTGGITIWTGFGDDSIDIDGTHFRGGDEINGLRTITTLNTGLGNDGTNINPIVVDLDTDEDGFFVINTQGPYDHQLDLDDDTRYTGDDIVLFAGDHNTAADTVVVTVGGVALDPSVVFVNFDNNDVLITDGDAIADGQEVVVTVTADDGSTQTATFTGPQAIDADADVVDASGTTIPLIVFGGQGDDEITGGSNTNIIFGDRGEVLYHPIAPGSDIAAGVIGVTDDLFEGDATTDADVVTVLIDGTPLAAEDFEVNLLTNEVTILDTVALAGATEVVVVVTDAQGNQSFESFVGPQGIGTTPDATDGTLGLLIDVVDIAPATVVVAVDGVVLSETDYILDRARNLVTFSDSTVPNDDTTTTTTTTTTGPETVTTVTVTTVTALSTTTTITTTTTDADGTTTTGPETVTTVTATTVTITVTPETGPAAVETFAAGDIVAADYEAQLAVDVVAAHTDSVSVKLDGLELDESLFTVDTTTNEVTFDDSVDLGQVAVITVRVRHSGNKSSVQTLVGPKAGFEAQATTVLGNGGPGDRTSGFDLDPTAAYSEQVAIGGIDTITTQDANDLVIGGAAGDTLTAANGDNIVIGDSARVLFNDGLVINAITLAPGVGGIDTITTGDDDDIFIGGTGGDTINAGDGRDIGLGDNGQIIFDLVDGENVLRLIESIATDIGGNDTISLGQGDDVLIAGVGTDYIDYTNAPLPVLIPTSDTGADVIVGDNGRAVFDTTTGAAVLDFIETTASVDGAADYINAGEGPDVVLGGSGGDVIHAGVGDFSDVVLGDNGEVDFDTTTVPGTAWLNDHLDGYRLGWCRRDHCW